MTKRLRYTGPQATTFKSPPIGRVEPGAEFDVRDEDAPRFLGRRDIEVVGGKAKTGKAGTPPPPADVVHEAIVGLEDGNQVDPPTA